MGANPYFCAPIFKSSGDGLTSFDSVQDDKGKLKNNPSAPLRVTRADKEKFYYEQTTYYNKTCECGYRATQLVRCGRYQSNRGTYVCSNCCSTSRQEQSILYSSR